MVNRGSRTTLVNSREIDRVVSEGIGVTQFSGLVERDSYRSLRIILWFCCGYVRSDILFDSGKESRPIITNRKDPHCILYGLAHVILR